MLGISGDLIEIKNNLVYKTCKTNQERFLKNINKQINYNGLLNKINILEKGISNNENYIVMPYIKCINSIEYISQCSFEDVKIITDKLINNFKFLIKNSKIEKLNNCYIEKIDELIIKINDYEIKSILQSIKNIEHKDFYYGDYHGDFTFANLFIFKNEIYAFDFLHSFIESPIHDIVKIRQDTKYLWTLDLLNVKDRNKVIIVLNYIDNRIKQFIESDSILNEYYNVFQILNLARIIPYNKNEQTFKKLKKYILDLKCQL